MNDKIKHLLENAEKIDAIAQIKWRIENREQLREQRKKELEELMKKDEAMKKLLIATLLIGMVSSCEEPTVKTTPTDKVVDMGVSGIELKTTTIEGCEYFVGRYDRSAVFCHKGNCKNLIHKGGNK